MLYFNNLERDVKNELSHYLLDNICKNVPRVTVKFVYDMVWGILASRSSKISNIGRRLFEGLNIIHDASKEGKPRKKDGL